MPKDEKKKVSIPLLFDNFETAEKIAIDLIKNHHPDLASARFRYICRNKAAKRGKTPILGNICKMSGKYIFLTDCDYVMEIALETWNDLAPNQRKALVDHLLTRCYGEEDESTGDMKWRIRPPVVQEFPEVAERHGQWNESLVDMEKSLRSK